jgi:hypothetical protein
MGATSVTGVSGLGAVPSYSTQEIVKVMGTPPCLFLSFADNNTTLSSYVQGLIFVDTNNGNTNINMPPPAMMAGRTVTFVNNGNQGGYSMNISLQGIGSSNYSVTAPGSVTFSCDGQYYYIIGYVSGN